MLTTLPVPQENDCPNSVLFISFSVFRIKARFSCMLTKWSIPEPPPGHCPISLKPDRTHKCKLRLRALPDPGYQTHLSLSILRSLWRPNLHWISVPCFHLGNHSRDWEIVPFYFISPEFDLNMKWPSLWNIKTIALHRYLAFPTKWSEFTT